MQVFILLDAFFKPWAFFDRCLKTETISRLVIVIRNWLRYLRTENMTSK
jgi:hypothetical protein